MYILYRTIGNYQHAMYSLLNNIQGRGGGMQAYGLKIV